MWEATAAALGDATTAALAASISSTREFVTKELPEVLELTARSLKKFPLLLTSWEEWDR